MSTMTATFGAGCFWGVEAAFMQLPGVIATQVGYMGGEKADPSYEEVCSGTTGHAEVVQVTFDPERISFDELLHVFWECHDPTQLNRQGPDVGTNYRSVIFCHSPAQEAAALAALAREQLRPRYARPIVTTIETAGIFWQAEEYHQQYLARHSTHFCH
jgi:peptide-methionine (S)-S-oxide reductase